MTHKERAVDFIQWTLSNCSQIEPYRYYLISDEDNELTTEQVYDAYLKQYKIDREDDLRKYWATM